MKMTIWSIPGHEDKIKQAFITESKNKAHWAGFKTPQATVYKRVCDAIGLHFVSFKHDHLIVVEQ